MKYIKSPINYTGGKYRLLKQIIPKMPKDITMFVDIFGGAGNVFPNVDAEEYIYNDNCGFLGMFLKELYEKGDKAVLQKLEELILKYNLSKSNGEEYEKLRSDFNELKETDHEEASYLLFLLTCYSFSNMMRFNKKGKFNVNLAGDRCYSQSQIDRIETYFYEIKSKKIRWYFTDFMNIDLDSLPEGTFVYLDPPYLGSVATYNEQGQWTEEAEKKVHKLCDELNRRGIKFMLSNNLVYENDSLKEWMCNYYVTVLHGTQYRNCNYHKKKKGSDTEIIITNYLVEADACISKNSEDM